MSVRGAYKQLVRNSQKQDVRNYVNKKSPPLLIDSSGQSLLVTSSYAVIVTLTTRVKVPLIALSTVHRSEIIARWIGEHTALLSVKICAYNREKVATLISNDGYRHTW